MSTEFMNVKREIMETWKNKDNKKKKSCIKHAGIKNAFPMKIEWGVHLFSYLFCQLEFGKPG